MHQLPATLPRRLGLLAGAALAMAMVSSCNGTVGNADAGGGGGDHHAGQPADLAGGRDGGADGPASGPDQGPDAGEPADVPVAPDRAMSPDSGAPPDAGPLPDGSALPDGNTPDYPTGADAGPASTRQTARFAGTTDSPLGFFEYLPPGYGDGLARPLMVFWHGIGEDGDGSEAQLPIVLRNGPPALISRDQWPNDRPFVVLSPQNPGSGCPGADEIHDFIAFGLSHYEVDERRVYLTGLSCGAIGSWGYLGQYLDSQITAIVPIAGDGRGAWARSMCQLGNVPIWAFHGDADPTVDPQGSIQPLTDLMTCPAPPRQEVKLTIYPGVGHDSWTRTYDLSAGNDIYSWMLGFARPATP
jgi:hypothetical protein